MLVASPLFRINGDSTGFVQPRLYHAPSRRAIQPGSFDSVRPGVCPVDIPVNQVKGQTFWRGHVGFCDDFHRRAVQKRSGDSVQGNIRHVNPFFFRIVGQSYRLAVPEREWLTRCAVNLQRHAANRAIIRPREEKKVASGFPLKGI